MGWAALDMPGMGQCGVVIAGDPPTAGQVWPGQQIEMIYNWNNTWDSGTPSLTSGYIPIDGKHFTNGIAKPGWVPLVDPHPAITALYVTLGTARQHGMAPTRGKSGKGFPR